MAKSPDERYSTATELARALTAALGTTSDVTPSRLQAAAEQTIQDLTKAREERAKATAASSEAGSPPVPPSGTTAGAAPTSPEPAAPQTGSQTIQRPAVVGAVAGAGVVLLVLLIIGAVIFAITSKNSGDATSTAIAQSVAIFASQTSQAVGATLTATYRPSLTFTPSPTITNTAQPTLTYTFTVVPPTAT